MQPRLKLRKLFSWFFLAGAPPVWNVFSGRAGKRQSLGRDIFTDSGAGADSCTFTDVYRCHQSRIGADKNIVFNDSFVFVGTIIIASDRASTDIDRSAHVGIADITQVINFGTCADQRILGFHEVADFCLGSQPGARAQTGERSHLDAGGQFGILNYTIGMD